MKDNLVSGHGRWNVERLLRGWRHAQSKDIANKLNPCLVPWPALRDINGKDFQPYDIEAIKGPTRAPNAKAMAHSALVILPPA